MNTKRDTQEAALWPRPDFDERLDPLFLFVLSPPNSGSTLLAQVLNSASNAMLLHGKGEGQWLIPGLNEGHKWDADRFIDWESVKAVWLRRFQLVSRLVGQTSVVIEKSPPLLLHGPDLRRTFPNSRLFTLNRDPYANCSSTLFRYDAEEALEARKRQKILRRHARNWLTRGRAVREAIEHLGALSISYEQLCRAAQETIDEIAARVPELATVDINRKVSVKDYPLQTISDQNARQIERLDEADIQAISAELQSDRELVEYFDYRLL